MSKRLFLAVGIVYFVATLYMAMTIPISPHEAESLYLKKSIDTFLMNLCYPYLEGFIAFRLPYYLFGVLNLFLFWELSRYYYKTSQERYIATTLFILLPGIVTSMILVNISVVVIAWVLIFLNAYHKNWSIVQSIALIVLLFVHDSAIVFFISLAIYGYFRDKKYLLVVALLLVMMALWMGEYLEIGGLPRGHFATIFGLYIAIFSPFVFVYFCYTLYRLYHEKKHDIVWYIASMGLLFSFLLSIRQQVIVTEFSPYILIGSIFLYRVYSESLKVRLKIYQTTYKKVFLFTLTTLLLGTMSIFLHRPLFWLFEDKSRHFAYAIYEPYWLAQALKAQNIHCYDTKFIKKAAQLQYYEIPPCASRN
ncbi:MAG: hypothetical protein KU38_10695 [Sulfurovum sp. FS08-3]|nr:MAG: hypothetical protein KU38_10695 [Sulfurovum sp. FS08-3]